MVGGEGAVDSLGTEMGGNKLIWNTECVLL